MTYDECERQAVAQLVQKLKDAGREYPGTPLGGLLQFAAMHIEGVHEQLEKLREELAEGEALK